MQVPGPYTVDAPPGTGLYSVCHTNPSGTDARQAGVTVRVLSPSGLTKVQPSAVGLGTNPALTFHGAELSDLGTVGRFTPAGASCVGLSALPPLELVRLVCFIANGVYFGGRWCRWYE